MTDRFIVDDAGTLIDMQTRDTYDYVSDVCGLLNELTEENEQLKKEIEKITKAKENWAFISDCSVQVMNEEEKFKKDYLRIATNRLKKLQEENEQLKHELLCKQLDKAPTEPINCNCHYEVKERTSKTSLEDIIGIVKTDEPTNSVELKKELYK